MITIVLKRALIAMIALPLGICGTAFLMRSEPALAAVVLTGETAQVALGKRLFFDPALSRDGKVSCASCHQAEHAFTDGKSVSVGFEGKTGLRNSMSLLNVANQRHFFWDGRKTRLEDQVLDPLLNPLEHAMADQDAILTVLSVNPSYKDAFRRAFPGPDADVVQMEKLASALASFVRTLTSPESAIDRFIVNKDTNALSADARAGFAVFSGKAQCISCHSLKPDATSGRILLSDDDFHAHSAAFYAMHQSLNALARDVLTRGKTLADTAREDPQGVDALGRFMVTGKLSDVGAFRTPSLRNVSRTAPYFHDGRAPTLELALDQELLGHGSDQISITPEEKRVLMTFLKALDDDK